MKAILGLILLVVVLLVAAGCRPHQEVARWEYHEETIRNDIYRMQPKVKDALSDREKYLRDTGTMKSESGDFDMSLMEVLAQRGAEGWELVSAIPQGETVPDAEFISGSDYDPGTRTISEKRSRFTNVRTGKLILLFKRPAR